MFLQENVFQVLPGGKFNQITYLHLKFTSSKWFQFAAQATDLQKKLFFSNKNFHFLFLLFSETKPNLHD